MTELEAKARDCIENHTHKLVAKPSKQDIYLREESIYISAYRQCEKEYKPKQEILTKHILELQADKGKLIDENRELSFQLENKEHIGRTAYVKGIRAMTNALKKYDREEGAFTDYFEHTVDEVLKRLLKETEL